MPVNGATTYGSYASSPQLNLRSNSSSSSASCPTCGANQAARIGAAYSGGYTGRTGSDTYVCATCQGNAVPRSTSGTYSSTSSSASCPTCGRSGSASSSYASSSSSSAYCPTCGKSGSGGAASSYAAASSSRGGIVSGLSWAR